MRKALGLLILFNLFVAIPQTADARFCSLAFYYGITLSSGNPNYATGPVRWKYTGYGWLTISVITPPTKGRVSITAGRVGDFTITYRAGTRSGWDMFKVKYLTLQRYSVGVCRKLYSYKTFWVYRPPFGVTLGCRFKEAGITNQQLANKTALQYCKQHTPVGKVAIAGSVVAWSGTTVTRIKCTFKNKTTSTFNVSLNKAPAPVNFAQVCKASPRMPANATYISETHTGSYSQSLTCKYDQKGGQDNCAKWRAKGYKQLLSYQTTKPKSKFPTPPGTVGSVTYMANVMQKITDQCVGINTNATNAVKQCISFGRIILTPTPPTGTANPMQWCGDTQVSYKQPKSDWSALLQQMSSNADRKIKPDGCSVTKKCIQRVPQNPEIVQVQSDVSTKVKKVSCHILTTRTSCTISSVYRKTTNVVSIENIDVSPGYWTAGTGCGVGASHGGYTGNPSSTTWTGLCALVMGLSTNLVQSTTGGVGIGYQGRYPCYKINQCVSKTLANTDNCASIAKTGVNLISTKGPVTSKTKLYSDAGYNTTHDITATTTKVYESINKAGCTKYQGNQKFVETGRSCVQYKTDANGGKYCADEAITYADFTSPPTEVFFQ